MRMIIAVDEMLIVAVAACRVSDPVFFQIPDPGFCTSNGEIFSNVHEINVLDTIKRHIFCFFLYLCFQTSSENARATDPVVIFSGSGALAITETYDIKSIKTKKVSLNSI